MGVMGEMSKKKNLAESHPALAAEALFDATEVTAGSNRKREWRCAEGHEWKATVFSRSKGAGCPFCSGRQVIPGVNDLATTHPALASEALFDATNVKAGSHVKGVWRCAEGHQWDAVIDQRVRGAGCPFCSNRKVLPGFNDLATTDPDLAAEALFDPTSISRGSGKKVLWRCSEGHQWEATAEKRSLGKGCPFCSNKQVLPGFNDLATTDPDLAAEALFDATKVTAGSSREGIWQCVLGHQWRAVIASRNVGAGCPFCSGHRVLPGFNDLATTHPDLAAEALFDATKVSSGSGAKRRWRCSSGHQWAAMIANRAKGVGCPNCASYGFHPERQAWLYLMHHDQWGMLQIGITNNPDRRAREHQSDGWSLIDIRGPMDGVFTQELEKDILKFLKQGARVSLSTSRRSQYDGESGRRGEAWLIEQYRPKSLADLVNATIEWHEARDSSEGDPKGN
jgi:5-carboxymethyl-2-hydroxymuconate isomerase